ASDSSRSGVPGVGSTDFRASTARSSTTTATRTARILPHRRSGPFGVARDAAYTAARKAASAVAAPATRAPYPGLPVSPDSTRLPVMLAVNTPPSSTNAKASPAPAAYDSSAAVTARRVDDGAARIGQAASAG